MRFPGALLLILVCSLVQGQEISWQELPPLPDKIGFNGSFIGVVDGDIIVAGGANFPEKQVWEGGQKAWYDQVFVLVSEDEGPKWITEPGWKLPVKLGYGVAIEYDNSLWCFGGSNEDSISNSVIRITWNSSQRALTTEVIGKMPVGLASMSADRIDDKIYFAGGFDKLGGDATSHFFSYDLKNGQWFNLPSWPGPPRINPVVIAQNNGKEDCLFLFSGRNFTPQSETPHALHSDVYSYHPKANQWIRLDTIPSNDTPGMKGGFLGAAPAVKIGGSHILVFGGAGGAGQRLLQRMELAREMASTGMSLEGLSRLDSLKALDFRLVIETRFSRTIWSYHTITDSWVRLGEFPGESQVVTRAVWWKDQVVIVGGEVGPGVRTTRAIAFSLVEDDESFGFLNYSALAAYLLVIIVIGWYFSRKVKTTNDYFLGGQGVPWWAAGLSIYATQLSAITYLAIPALAFAYDWQAYLGMLGILLMAPIVIRYYLPHYRGLSITTAYEYLESRFSLAVRMFGSLSFVLYQLVRMGIVVYLPALAISAVIGLDIYSAILVMGVLAIVYTVLGGIEAVIWTDVLQVVVLIGGIFIGLIFVARDLGGFGEMVSIADSADKFRMFDWRFSTNEVVTWSLFFGSFALNIAPYTADQTVVQRYLTTKDSKATARSIWLNGLMTLPAAALIFLMGSALFAFYSENPENLKVGMENDGIFPLFIANELPAGIAGLLVAGIFSASMSSLDSSMHSVSTVISVDFYKRFRKKATDATLLQVGKMVTIVTGAFGTLVACLLAMSPTQSIFFLFQEVIGLLGSSLAGIFILGVFFRKATGSGALTGAVLCLLSVAFMKYQTDLNFYIYPIIGIPICVLAGLMFSRKREQ